MWLIAKKGLRAIVWLAGAAVFAWAAQGAASDAGWYSGVLADFERAGYLSASAIVPAEPAARSRLADLLVRLKGGVVHGPFPQATFDDVPSGDPHFYVFEEAALQGWVRGARNCAGIHPCSAYPRRTVNRAEAAAMLVRAFALTAASASPTFTDLPEGAWYAQDLRIAASRCIFRGDDGRGTVRPADRLNQAEMLAVLQRAVQGLSFPQCQEEGSPLPSAPASLQMQIPLPVPASSAAASPTMQSSAPAWLLPLNSSAPSSAAFSVGVAASSAINSVAAQASDTQLSTYLSKYDAYVASFGSFLEATKIKENMTNLQIVNLLKAQMTMMATYYQYVTIARERPLAEGERQVIGTVMQTIEQGFENIRSLKTSGAAAP